MRRFIWAKSFRRAFKRHVQQRPELQLRVEKALRLLEEDPFDPALHTHRLKGKLAQLWACTVDYDSRILFMFLTIPETEEEAIL